MLLSNPGLSDVSQSCGDTGLTLLSFLGVCFFVPFEMDPEHN